MGKAGRKQSYKSEEVVAAIVQANGYISRISDILGCSHQTIYNYRDRYATVRQAMADTKTKRTDYVEDQLMKAIREGNVTAMIFYLKTQAKDRGYIERTEFQHSGSDGKEITFKIIRSSNGG